MRTYYTDIKHDSQIVQLHAFETKMVLERKKERKKDLSPLIVTRHLFQTAVFVRKSFTF